jgi:hypothetical protein
MEMALQKSNGKKSMGSPSIDLENARTTNSILNGHEYETSQSSRKKYYVAILGINCCHAFVFTSKGIRIDGRL